MHPSLGEFAEGGEGDLQAIAGLNHQAARITGGFGGLSHVLESEAVYETREQASPQIVRRFFFRHVGEYELSSQFAIRQQGQAVESTPGKLYFFDLVALDVRSEERRVGKERTS